MDMANKCAIVLIEIISQEESMRRYKLLLSIMAAVIILVGCENNKNNTSNHLEMENESLNTYSLNEDGIILSEDGERLVEDIAFKVIDALSKKDFKTLSSYIHSVKGLSFSPYTYINKETNLVFDKEKLNNFMEDNTEYHWGVYDGRGDDIILTPAAYYDEFIYSADFKNAEEVSYNKTLSFGNMIANEHEIYENAIVVEFYFSGFNEEYEGIDWKSLKLVFQEESGSWKLVCIINNEWTV